jgi:CrcB protein
MFKNFLLVGIGGAIGSVLRYLFSQMIKSGPFPLATFTVNIIGSFLIGIFIALSIKQSEFNSSWKIFLATGICGGFTTFSSFSIENLQLIQQGKWMTSLLYIAGSILLGVIATAIGYKIAG